MHLHPPLLLALAFFTAPLGAQIAPRIHGAVQPRPVTQGDTVRFSPEPRGVYIVQEVHGDSLVVSSTNGSERGVSARGRVIFRAGGPDHGVGAARGVLRGAGAGLVVGALYGYAQGDDGGYAEAALTAEQKAGLGALLAGFLGTGVGGALGWLNPLTRWEAVTSPSAAATLAPVAPDGRPGLVLMLRF